MRTSAVLGDWLIVALALAALGVALSLGGCSLRPSRSARTAAAVVLDPALVARCARLDRAVIGLTVGTVAAGALGGSTGLTALLDGQSRWVTGGVAVGVTVAGATLGALSNLYSARYTRACTTGAGQ